MLKPVKNVKIYEAVMEQIKDLVKKGELKRGDKLPSERELCDILKVSRTSVREALKALEMLGLVESRHGGGNYIKDNFENNLIEPLSIVFLLLGSNSRDVLELRKIIEPETASIAAQAINEEQLKELKDILESINKISDPETCAELDREFHYKIAQASGNPLISTIMKSISALIEQYIKNSNILTVNKTLVQGQHEEIYKALEAHNSVKAAQAVKRHLEAVNHC